MAERIRILFTIPNFKTAGSGREMFNIIERLDKDIFEPWIATQQEGGALHDEIKEKGYPLLVLPFIIKKGGLTSQVQLARAYARAFRPYNFRIWQSFNWSSDFSEALVAKWAGAKYVYVKKNMNWNRMAWKVKSFLSHAIVARNTDLIKAHFSPWYFRRKTYYITGGVPTDRFKKLDKTTFREQHNIPSSAFLITCIAQLVKVKDQATLIKAFAKLSNAYLVLAGADRDEAYTNELKELIRGLGLCDKVLLPGSISGVNELLNASDVFVLPTGKLHGHEEGCPVALLEAMAAGTPCIASDVAGSRDLINHGETGLLFSPGDAEHLLSTLKKYQEDKDFAAALAAKALNRVKQKHTLKDESVAFAAMYKKIAASR